MNSDQTVKKKRQQQAVDEAVSALEASQTHSDRARAVAEARGLGRLRAMALATTGTAVPYVGNLIQGLFDVTFPGTWSRRLEDLWTKLAASMDELELTVNELPQTPEDYADIVEAVIPDAMRASEEQKRTAYAAVLLNALITPGDDEERLLMVDLLRRCRTIHIRILGVLVDPTATFESHLLFTLRSRLDDYSFDMIRVAWADLYGWGLLAVPGGASLQDSTIGAGRKALLWTLSPIGAAFVKFITVPRRPL